LKENFVKTKLLTQTTSTSVYDYLLNSAPEAVKNSGSVKSLVNEITIQSQTADSYHELISLTYFEFEKGGNSDDKGVKDKIKELFEKVIKVLSENTSYIESFLTDMMAYSYL